MMVGRFLRRVGVASRWAPLLLPLLLSGCKAASTPGPQPQGPEAVGATPAAGDAPPSSAQPAAAEEAQGPGAAAAAGTEGTIKYIEPSGKNLYLELLIDGKIVGVELLPSVAGALGSKLKPGMTIGIRGKRLPGDDSVAYVIEVESVESVTMPGAASGALQALDARGQRGAGAALEMIVGVGIWPPVDAGEIADRIAAARADGATQVVIDSGLTELWRAYQQPEPFFEVVRKAATAARGIGSAFYFPSFELRREKGSKKRGRLLDWTRDWAQVTLSGKPFVKTSFDKDEFWNKDGDEVLWVCPNSPWRKVFIERMVGAVKRGASTLFVDVPYFQQSEQHMTCRCKHCQARFNKDTGKTIPTRRQPGDATYRRWIAWRHQVLGRFFGDLRAAVRAVNPRARLVVEEYPSYIEDATTQTGLDIGLIGAEVDGFAHEYSEKQFDKKPYSEADRLRAATALSIYRGLDDRRPTWLLSYAHDARGSRATAALQLAYEASFWETKAPEMNNTSVGRSWRRKLFGWFGKHRDAFGNSVNAATVAVLYSAASRDFTPDHFATLTRVLRTLIEARVPFRVLSTRDLGQLGRYRTVVLPAVVALAPAEAAALRAARARLVAVGAPPSKGPLGIAERNHRLRLERSGIAGLVAKLGPQPVVVQGSKLIVNLFQREGEIQLRLANLASKPSRAVVRVRVPGVKGATLLPLLGKPSAIRSSDEGGAASYTIPVNDLTVLRLRLK